MKRRLRIWLREYFSFTKSERNGILVLAGILFSLIAVQLFLKNRPAAAIQVDHAWIDSVRMLLGDMATDSNELTWNESREPNESRRYTKNFDPNTASYDELVKVGFFPSTASNMIKYRSKGGRFKKPEDLLKIYGLSEKFFRRIESQIEITSIIAEQERPKIITKKPDRVITPVELNSADSALLITLPGIGPYYAGKMVTYRKALGGYYHPYQLLELWNFRSGLLDTLRPFLLVDTTLIRKININSATEQELYSHPYIRKKAKGLINYREAHKGITAIDFEKVLILTDEDRKKLRPYIEF